MGLLGGSETINITVQVYLSFSGVMCMNESWNAFLEKAGARVENDRVECFSDIGEEAKAATESDIIADLSHFSVVRVTGDDAQGFLHNQFTNDVRRVSGEQSELNSYCTAKGRMLSVFRLFRLADGAYALRMPQEVSEGFLKKLRMFVLMSKVEIEDASDSLMRFGVSGPHVSDALQGLVGTIPDAVNGVVHAGDITIMRIPGPHPRFEIYGPEAEMARLWTGLAEVAKPVGHDAWALLDIHAAIPTVYEGTVEAFVPQMANMQLVEGVSFKKGCYPGQEIVARMQYLGNLKRRMYRAHIDTAERPFPGDALFSVHSKSGQGTGKVVDARPSPEGGYELLAVVQIDCAEADDVHLHEADGPKLSFLNLPYPVETKDAPQPS